ncbi:cell division protein FtsQ/DivIB [Actinopolyspora saharensis]|uniref:Cell division protein FtsQ n=1 Tax=Actinopolyspora saharensis TaxID=995062 RepID=A0A1H1ASE2_9ACTN|nr:FtsQ-type POTRA domain-containing protein [Actinopolyspora saharensis]SDQ42635.1 cell division protein FtsQ [Actinopolyspora saharensis]
MRESGRARSSGGRTSSRTRGGRDEEESAGRGRIARWIVLVALALITTAAVLVFFTPALGVRSVRVSGTEVLDAGRVSRVASIEEGTPIVRVDRAAVRERVTGISRVESADVRLVWPSTVRIRVVEREPVLFERVSGGVRLVDDDGVGFAEVPEPSRRMPELRLPEDVGEQRTEEAITAFTSLDEKVRKQVRVVELDGSGGVRLLLTRGRTVEWGSAAESELKAAVLPALLTRQGRVYDVTAPELPTVS